MYPWFNIFTHPVEFSHANHRLFNKISWLYGAHWRNESRLLSCFCIFIVGLKYNVQPWDGFTPHGNRKSNKKTKKQKHLVAVGKSGLQPGRGLMWGEGRGGRGGGVACKTDLKVAMSVFSPHWQLLWHPGIYLLQHIFTAFSRPPHGYISLTVRTETAVNGDRVGRKWGVCLLWHASAAGMCALLLPSASGGCFYLQGERERGGRDWFVYVAPHLQENSWRPPEFLPDSLTPTRQRWTASVSPSAARAH